MTDWCPENDGAYRAEMAALHPVQNRKRIKELEPATRLDDPRVKALVEALRDVIDEYDRFRRDEYDRGLSPLDDEIDDARAAISALEENK